MAATVVDASVAPPPPELTTDVCVIGSGPAGATAAWELAAAGRDVVVLEEGGDRTGSRLTQRDAAMYDQLYMDRAGRATDDLSITVLQGRALGGGSVINVCDVVPVGDGVLAVWRRRFGLTDITPETLEPYRAAALADLSASRPSEEEINDNNRILRAGAGALGLRGEVMMHNRVGCLGIGTCMLGCPADAKRNARFVAIPAALGAGARFFTRVRATRIADAGHEMKIVHARTLDGAGHLEQRDVRVRARTVVLAANAVGSAALLLRTGIGNDHVGRHLSLQPQLPVTAIFDREVRFFRGIPQSYAITEHEDLAHPEHGWWGFRIESISGTPGIVASLLPRLGVEGKEQMTHYPRMAAVLCLTPDVPHGQVLVERSGRLRVRYTLDDEQKQRLREAAKVAARLFLAAGAREVLVPVVPPVSVARESEISRIDAIPLRSASAPLLSAHQQGGVRMAPDALTGAAAPDGQVYGTRGVHVLDSGLFPTSAASHTMAPIITVSRYLARNLAATLPR